jgi:putative transposase
VSYQGKRFEVPFELSGKTVCLVVDPHSEAVIEVEDEHGEGIGLATPLDALANLDRQRNKPDRWTDAGKIERSGPNLIELVHQQYYDRKGD